MNVLRGGLAMALPYIVEYQARGDIIIYVGEMVIYGLYRSLLKKAIISRAWARA